MASIFQKNTYRLLFLVISAVPILLTACQNGTPTERLPSPYPTEYLPTVIALTAQALRSPTADNTTSPTLKPVLGKPTSATKLPTNSTSAVATPTRTPTPSASPTEGPTNTATRRPTFTPTPTRTRWPTRTPTITLTPEVPLAAIQIFAPGPMSKVLTPLRTYAYLKPGESNKVQIELLGEDGRLLLRKIEDYSFYEGNPIGILEELDFEIAGVSEKARLVISTDDTFGRLQSVGSVDLLLLSLGEKEINPPGDLFESIVINQPIPSALIQGGSITVEGQARLGGGDLQIQLIDGQKKLVGYAWTPLDPALGQIPGFGGFSVQVPYLASSPTWVRLSVSQSGQRPDGLIHLTSIEVLISP